MKIKFNATGLVYGNCWGGGRVAYPSKPLKGYSSLKTLMAKARKMCKSGALDSGMGFESLIGAILVVEEVRSIDQIGETFTNSVCSHHFLGKLSSKDKGFLLDNINMFLI